jgi:hypothetical protein
MWHLDTSGNRSTSRIAQGRLATKDRQATSHPSRLRPIYLNSRLHMNTFEGVLRQQRSGKPELVAHQSRDRWLNVAGSQARARTVD